VPADAASPPPLPRSYGYDPLGLGQTAEQVEKYREFELIHARWAMLGALGAILPEALDSFGGNISGAVWWQVRSGCARLSAPARRRAARRRAGVAQLQSGVVCGSGPAFCAPAAARTNAPRSRRRAPRRGAAACAGAGDDRAAALARRCLCTLPH
jgi:hypothetical protein